MRDLLRTLLATAGLAAVFSAPAYATIYEGLFNGAPTGGNIPYADGTTPGQLDASSLSDNGSSVTGTEPINATLVVSVANAGTTGTTATALAKLNSSGNAVITATTDTSGAIGVVVLGAGTTGNALIAKEGTVTCSFDSTGTTAGDYVQISSTAGGDCHDAGSTYPTSGQVLGRAISTNTGAGNYSMLLGPGIVGSSGGGGSGTVSNCSVADAMSYYSSTGTTVGCLSSVGSSGQVLTSNGAGAAPTWQTLSGGGNVSTSSSLTSNYIPKATGTSNIANSSIQDNGTAVSTTEPMNGVLVVSIPNAGSTGTTTNSLAKLTSGNALITATTDTSGAVGVVVSGGGTTGNALIAKEGLVTCAFDGTATAGDYVKISSSTAGDCTDAGSTYPTSGQVMGRVQAGGSGAGNYTLLLGAGTVASSGGGGASCPSPFSLSSTTGQCYLTENPATSSTNCASSTAACIAWTGLPSSINEYHIRCWGLQAGSGNSPGVQLGTGSTPTWEISGYHYAYVQWHSASSTFGGSESAVGFLQGGGAPTSGAFQESSTWNLHGLNGSGYPSSDASGDTYVSSTNYGWTEAGQLTSTTAVTAIRIVDTQTTPTSLSSASGSTAYCTLYPDIN